MVIETNKIIDNTKSPTINAQHLFMPKIDLINNSHKVEINKLELNNNKILPYLPVDISNNNKYKENDIYKICKMKAMKAYDNNKIFTMFGNSNSGTIRNVFKKLGWIEKCNENYLPELHELNYKELFKYYEIGNNYETIILTKLLKKYDPTLIWHNIHISSKLLELVNPKYQNRITRSKLLNFTTKEGLIGCIENAYWTTNICNFEIRSPRIHRLSAPEEKSDFIQDYQITCCLSLLKFISENDTPKSLFNIGGRISINILKNAIKRITYELKLKNNKNNYNNTTNLLNKNCKNYEWKNFCLPVKLIINGEEKFNYNKLSDVRKLICKCQKLVEKADTNWSDLWTDGYNNLWILKPSFCSQGVGIVIKNNIDEIFSYALRHIDKRYIVQKYIERPLLIYNTKFDIRQYALITITDNKVHLWMHKNCCYLRFSSQQYQLSVLTESIHLTNNSIQKKYKNGLRNINLPEHNMWSLDDFKNYLKIKAGDQHNDIWHKIIYDNMKKNFIAVVLASLIDIDIIPGSFELFGCDFMLDEDYEPILIEINSSPDLSPSTIVTEKLCPKVIEDLIFVVTQFPTKHLPICGNFELIYSFTYPKLNNTNKLMNFELKGKPIGIVNKIPHINKVITKKISLNKNYSYKTNKQKSKIFKKNKIQKSTVQFKNIDYHNDSEIELNGKNVN